METRDAEWMSLEALLSMDEGPSIGAIATAIEKGGIWGVDRYGRFRRFDGGSAEAREALDALAQQYAFMAEEHLRDAHQYDEPPRSPLEMADEFSSFSRYGWPRDETREFDNFTSSEPPMPTSLRRLTEKGGTAKGEKADLHIIGALYAFIQGKDGADPHPNFTTQTALIECLAHRYAGVLGLTRGNLERKLPNARRGLEYALAVPTANTPEQ